MKITRSAIKQARKFCDMVVERKSQRRMFYELCFVICSPQTKWDTNIKVNKELQGLRFYSKKVPLERLQRIVRPVRYYRNKSRYLMEAKSQWPEIHNILCSDFSPVRKRKWLVANVKGLGLKTASHFLRNAIGVEDLAILDTHLLQYLKYEGTPTPQDYLELEKKLRKKADRYGISIITLDAVIFMRGSKAEYLR